MTCIAAKNQYSKQPSKTAPHNLHFSYPRELPSCNSAFLCGKSDTIDVRNDITSEGSRTLIEVAKSYVTKDASNYFVQPFSFFAATGAEPAAVAAGPRAAEKAIVHQWAWWPACWYLGNEVFNVFFFPFSLLITLLSRLSPTSVTYVAQDLLDIIGTGKALPLSESGQQ